MSRYITKYMNIKKSKRSIFWNGKSNKLTKRDTGMMVVAFRRRGQSSCHLDGREACSDSRAEQSR